ncbi:DUF5060 domain-containing protein [Paenibacillus sp. OAS669]|uniref:DUF5060 domain-containing protein n=1 Tax=Paenibacillus sp. OAS669 TaxID=2663821 RepID=UPI001789318D|nr:DUF5060 domain-containing protein [Paenibacillus sp. OAS669]MBE1442992.1 hypothetical protein [Paenibacillus sp. OAS669]
MVSENQLQTSERWGVFELSLSGPDVGNPFVDVQLQALFQHTTTARTVTVEGFYDGNGVYKVRFMPDAEGEWSFTVKSGCSELDGAAGHFLCTAPSADNHGPVRVKDADRFGYEDGSIYRPIGTTCYAWTHQSDMLQEQTLQSLADSPFNKIRMCLFPKRYSFNTNEPERFPFEGSREEGFQWTRFNPEYFHRLEKRLVELQQLGIEADLILFHPYDKGHWGFDRMDRDTDLLYLRYVINRLAAFRNVWWSLANEFDFMSNKTMDDWDCFFQFIQEKDPYGHLRSIHNGTKMYDPSQLVLYDHTKPWVTHVSMQYWELSPVTAWRSRYRKPVVVDECCYEGNLPQRWGNITGEDMTARFWEGFARGGYVGHGETFLHPEDIIWWSKGGRLHGESVPRIAFLQRIFNELPVEAAPLEAFRDVPTIGVAGVCYLQYYGNHRPAYRELPLPEDASFQIDIIDTWSMEIQTLEGLYSGISRVELPGRPYLAVRARLAT